MRLLSIVAGPETHLGIAVDDGALDLTAAGAANRVRAPGSMHELLGGGDAMLDQVRRALDDWRSLGEFVVGESDVTFGPPVPRPSKIIGVGLNYRRHAEESGAPVPTTPILFARFGNTLSSAGRSLAVPRDDPMLDYEAELAVVIGRRCTNVAVSAGRDVVAGYMTANDVSARGLQFRTAQWTLGKCGDGHCPTGPYLVTKDDVPDAQALWIRAAVNGSLRQDANTADMVFSCDELVAYASRYMTLEPGDIILTGTPSGVAMGRADKPWLRPGDEVWTEVQGLGRLWNHVIAAGAKDVTGGPQ